MGKDFWDLGCENPVDICKLQDWFVWDPESAPGFCCRKKYVYFSILFQIELFQHPIFSSWRSLGKGEPLKLVFSGTKHHLSFGDNSGEQVTGVRSLLSGYLYRAVLLGQQPRVRMSLGHSPAMLGQSCPPLRASSLWKCRHVCRVAGKSPAKALSVQREAKYLLKSIIGAPGWLSGWPRS